MLQLTRISILLFYLTCLGKETRINCIGLMVLSGLFGAACTVVEFMQCTPTYMLWSGSRPAEYTCINQAQFFRVSGLINLICKRPLVCPMGFLECVSRAPPRYILTESLGPYSTHAVLYRGG